METRSVQNHIDIRSSTFFGTIQNYCEKYLSTNTQIDQYEYSVFCWNTIVWTESSESKHSGIKTSNFHVFLDEQGGNLPGSISHRKTKPAWYNGLSLRLSVLQDVKTEKLKSRIYKDVLNKINLPPTPHEVLHAGKQKD